MVVSDGKGHQGRYLFPTLAVPYFMAVTYWQSHIGCGFQLAILTTYQWMELQESYKIREFDKKEQLQNIFYFNKQKNMNLYFQFSKNKDESLLVTSINRIIYQPTLYS
jgi:hypothetical protein